MNFCTVFLALAFIAATTSAENRSTNHIVKISSLIEDNDENYDLEPVLDYHNGTVVRKIKRIQHISTDLINPSNKSAETKAPVLSVTPATKPVLENRNGTVIKKIKTIQQISTELINPSNKSAETKASVLSVTPATKPVLKYQNGTVVRKIKRIQQISTELINPSNKSAETKASVLSITPATKPVLKYQNGTVVRKIKRIQQISTELINPSNKSAETKAPVLSVTPATKPVLDYHNETVVKKIKRIQLINTELINPSNKSAETKAPVLSVTPATKPVLDYHNETVVKKIKRIQQISTELINPSNKSAETKAPILSVTPANPVLEIKKIKRVQQISTDLINPSTKTTGTKAPVLSVVPATKPVLEYHNGTVIKKIKSIQKISTDLVNPSTKSVAPFLNGKKRSNQSYRSKASRAPLLNVTSARKQTSHQNAFAVSQNTLKHMIEQVVSNILEKKVGLIEKNISKNIKAIKITQEKTRSKIDDILEKQDKLMKILVKESNITHRATDQLHSELEVMEKNQNKSTNHIQKDMRDSVAKLVDKLNAEEIDNAKEAKIVKETLQALTNIVQKVVAELVNKVEPLQIISYRKIKEIDIGQRNNYLVLKNESDQSNAISNLLKQEIKQIDKYHNSVLNGLRRIFTVNTKIENGTADIRQKLALCIMEIPRISNMNTRILAQEFQVLNNKNVHLLKEIRGALINGTDDGLINKLNRLGKDFNDMRRMQSNVSKETLSIISEAVKQLLSSKNELLDNFSKSFKNQKLLLHLVTQNMESIGGKIKNATGALLRNINATQYSIKNSIEKAEISIENTQTKTSKKLLEKINSSVNEIKANVLKKTNELLADLTAKIEKTTQKVENGLEKEFNTLKQLLFQKHKVLKGIKKEIGSMKDAISNDTAKRNDKNHKLYIFMKALDSQYQNLSKKIEISRETQKTKLKDILEEIIHTKNVLKKAIEDELIKVGSKYDFLSKHTNKNIKSIENIHKETRNIGRNIEKHMNDFRNNTPCCNSSKVTEDFPKMLNNSVKLILNSSNLYNKVITKKLDGEVNKILDILNVVNKDLSRSMKVIGNQTRSDILNGTKMILGKINDTVAHKTLGIEILKDTQDIKKQIGEMGYSLSKYEQKTIHYLSSIQKFMIGVNNTINKESKNCTNICKIGKDMINEFNEIKALLEKIICLAEDNNGKTQNEIDEARQSIEQVFRSALKDSNNQLSKQSVELTKKLLNRMKKTASQNKKSENVILDRIEEANHAIRKEIASKGKKISQVSQNVLENTKKIEPMIHKTKRYLRGLIIKSNRQLSKEIADHHTLAEIMIHNLGKRLLQKLKKICMKMRNYSSFKHTARTVSKDVNKDEQTRKEASTAGKYLIRELEKIINNTRNDLFDKIKSSKVDPIITNLIHLAVGNTQIILNTTSVELGKKSNDQNPLFPCTHNRKSEVEKIDKKQFYYPTTKINEHHTTEKTDLIIPKNNDSLKTNEHITTKIKDSKEYEKQNIKEIDNKGNSQSQIENINPQKYKIDSQQFYYPTTKINEHHTTKKIDLKPKINDNIKTNEQITTKIKDSKENEKHNIKENDNKGNSQFQIENINPQKIQLLARLLETRETFNDAIKKTTQKLSSKLREVRKEREEQGDENQGEKLKELKIIIDTRKSISRKGKFIYRYITQVMKYLNESKKNINEIVIRLLDDIQKTKEKYVRIFHKPKKLQLVLELIQKATSQISEELKKREK